MGRDRGDRQSHVSLEGVQCFHRGTLSSAAQRLIRKHEGLRALLLPQCFQGRWKRKRRPRGRRVSVWKRV